LYVSINRSCSSYLQPICQKEEEKEKENKEKTRKEKKREKYNGYHTGTENSC
jgi:hypothetical protein